MTAVLTARPETPSRTGAAGRPPAPPPRNPAKSGHAASSGPRHPLVQRTQPSLALRSVTDGRKVLHHRPVATAPTLPQSGEYQRRAVRPGNCPRGVSGPRSPAIRRTRPPAPGSADERASASRNIGEVARRLGPRVDRLGCRLGIRAPSAAPGPSAAGPDGAGASPGAGRTTGASRVGAMFQVGCRFGVGFTVRNNRCSRSAGMNEA